ncbi:MAG: hypothetical protein JWR50_3028 [Mucilaginibacter sp.]|nr:hypothetical protein [Mucilaginibacter sp.]
MSMKKIKLDAAKLALHKEKIATLTDGQMKNVYGGQPVTTATLQTCCVQTDVQCPPPPGTTNIVTAGPECAPGADGTLNCF